MHNWPLVVLSSAGGVGALALVLRYLRALARAVVFITDLPAQHRENIAAIADNTRAIERLTQQVQQLVITNRYGWRR